MLMCLPLAVALPGHRQPNTCIADSRQLALTTLGLCLFTPVAS